MTDKKISELSTITGAQVEDAADKLAIVDDSESTTKAITRSELFSGVGSATFDGSVTVGGDVEVTGTVDGRDVAADGLKLDGIEANADITDTANVTAAGALMDSELTNITAVKDLDQGVATTDSPTFFGGTFTADITIPDKIIHAGDTNTAIRFPAADTVTVEAAGSEAMRIDSSGNVGIGTSSPAAKLQAAGTSGSPQFQAGTASNGYFQVNAFDSNPVYCIVGGSNATAAVFGTQSNTPTIFFTNNAERMRITPTGNVGIGTSSPSEKLSVTGNVTISGSLSKGSGSFKIDHPVKPDTHYLVHSFIEGPQADNLYRGKVALVDGSATVNLDEACLMTEGTFVALNGNVQCFTNNEDGWTAVRGKVNGSVLTIEAQEVACTDTVSWLVIGERRDQHMIDANWTDDQGRVVTEPEKANDIQTETE